MVLIVSWLAACIAAGVFTLFPVDLPENLTLINLGAGLIAAGGTVAVWNRKQMLVPPELCGGVSHTKQSQEMKRSLIVQTVLVLVAGALVNLTSKAFEKRAGLPLINQVATWLLACESQRQSRGRQWSDSRRFGQLGPWRYLSWVFRNL